MKLVFGVMAGVLVWSIGAHAGDAPLQSGRQESRALATEGVQGLRPPDPRILEAAADRHRLAKAALPADERADLDALAGALRPRIFETAQTDDLLGGTVAIVRTSIP